MRRAVSLVVFVLLVIASSGALYNVMVDDPDTEHAAGALACGDDKACKAQMTWMERTPLARSFEFTTNTRKVGVRCTRAAIFFGSYACAVR
jgi:hypothetical protein